MDEDGYFYIVDRKKDMIIAGGFNIYPREIDEVLYEHPKVPGGGRGRRPRRVPGETVKAYVVLKPGEECTEEEIINVLPRAAGHVQGAAHCGVPRGTAEDARGQGAPQGAAGGGARKAEGEGRRVSPVVAPAQVRRHPAGMV